MVRTAVFLVCVCAVAWLQPTVSSQKAPSVAGQWDVTVRMPDRSMNERWTIQQKGTAITATAKGERELSASG